MDIDNYLMGAGGTDSYLKDFQWHNSRKMKMSSNNLPDPFPALCAGKESKVTSDAECSICPNRHRNICLAVEHKRQQGLGKSLVDKEQSYTKIERDIMSYLVICALNGHPWSELKSYLQSHYSKQDLIKHSSLLTKWLSQPGLLGHVIIDTDFFGDCRTAQLKILACKFRPMMVVQHDKCIECSHKIGDQCARLGSQLMTSETIVPVKQIDNRISEIRSAGLISEETDLIIRLLTQKNSIKALRLAVDVIGSAAAILNENDFIKSITSVGEICNRSTLTFENEPADVKEAKDLLIGNTMRVDIDPPTRHESTGCDEKYHCSGSGIDGYLNY